ncbi:hypothetical protein CTI12_AA388590 [Artemisia annua]|uniref:Uncharacterized protein n=1 Tax=Artemisia annua TaxID=35608 RepID=A0A2U1LQJ9_ARTAN|nr:hypothetical protein CTI12_AA388590 [Artemisia annua]
MVKPSYSYILSSMGSFLTRSCIMCKETPNSWGFSFHQGIRNPNFVFSTLYEYGHIILQQSVRIFKTLIVTCSFHLFRPACLPRKRSAPSQSRLSKIDDRATRKQGSYTGRREGATISLESIYETFKDDSTDHKVYYEITGMVRRMTEGGYDYYNPHGWERWCW